MGHNIEDIALTVGDITPSEELQCEIAQIMGYMEERVVHCQSRCDAIGVLPLLEPTRKRDCASRRENSLAKNSWETPGCYRIWSKTLDSFSNPLESLQVRLQAALRFVAQRASELGMLLLHYSKPGSAHITSKWFCCQF